MNTCIGKIPSINIERNNGEQAPLLRMRDICQPMIQQEMQNR